MNFDRPQEIVIDASGGTKTLVVQSTVNFYIITGSDTLGSDCTVQTDIAPPDGTTIIIAYGATINISTKALTICGTTLTAVQATKRSILTFKVYGGVLYPFLAVDMSESAWLETAAIVNKAVTIAKQADGTPGYALRYNAAGVLETFDAKTDTYLLIGNGTILQSVPQSGDVLFSNAGVSAIQANKITNTMINSGAVIDWSKMATSTAAFIIVFNGGGVPVPVALSGDATISNAGALSIGTGKITAAMLNASTSLVPITKRVSFETGEQQDNSFTAKFDGTIVFIEANVQTDIAAADNATIQAKVAGTNVTTGLITLPATTTVGNLFNCTPSGANTFTTGQVISLTGTKPTAGGVAEVIIWVRRT